MFGWGKKKDTDAQAEAQPGQATTDAAAPQQPTAASDQSQQVSMVANPPLSQLLPKPTSVFEFGPVVQLGSEYLRGVCTADDPDAVQACSWTIETLEIKGKEKRQLYRIEF